MRDRPSRRKSSTTRGPAAVELPLGLDELVLTVRTSKRQLDFARVLEAFGDKPSFSIRRDKKGVRGALSGHGTISQGHAHLEVAVGERSGEHMIELALIPGSHGRISPRALTIADAIHLLGVSLKDPASVRRVRVSANFSFDLKQWEPTLPLPFAPGTAAEQMPGQPQICGLDVAFLDRSPTQHLHRAFVTTYDEIERMVVRMLLTDSLPWTERLPLACLTLAGSHLSILTKVREAKSG